MSFQIDFEIEKHVFSKNLIANLGHNKYFEDLWPIVYILSDGKVREAYVGETTDTQSRMLAHLKNNEKNKLTTVHLITSKKFNKSATLDIESNLIKYIAGDGKYKLLNGNLGLANHTYFQKKDYWNIFTSLWNALRAQGITEHSLEYINNSDLFKYSPYKNLADDQRKGLMMIMESLLNGFSKNMIVEGGAGTGKTILAVFLFKILNSDNTDFNFKEFGEDQAEFVTVINHLKYKYPNPKMALVIPMSSFRGTMKKVFKNIKGLRANMVISPAEVTRNRYDILIVDESHRLRRRVNLGTYFDAFNKGCERLGLNPETSSELDFVTIQADKTILFYDSGQSIKPSDVRSEAFENLKARSSTRVEKLLSQFRVKGGNSYVRFIDKLLGSQSNNPNVKYSSRKYELLLFNSIDGMIDKIKERNESYGLSRVIAGFSWPWISKNNESLLDIDIDGTKLQWNTVTKDWISTKNSINEVGCIHTSQGYDLNYAGVIFGNEISYNKQKGCIEIIKENYFDKNGKQSIKGPKELEEYIINIYKTMMLRGIRGTYVYACNPNLRDYLGDSIEVADPEHHMAEIKKTEPLIPYVNSVPFYDLSAAAGDFSEQQQTENKEFIRVPEFHKPSENVFACTVIGESMNKIIPNGSICLFEKYSGGSRNGLIVLAELTSIQDSDFGSSYTVKEYHSTKVQGEDGWSHSTITLKPLSTNPKYKELILEDDDLKEFKVIGVFKGVLDI